jgi:hypothetical protein
MLTGRLVLPVGVQNTLGESSIMNPTRWFYLVQTLTELTFCVTIISKLKMSLDKTKIR